MEDGREWKKVQEGGCICVIMTDVGFSLSSVGKESACNAGDPGMLLGSGRSPGDVNGNPFQYSCLENTGQRSLVVYGLWGHKSRTQLSG